MNCVLVVLTNGDDDHDLLRVLPTAHDLAEPKGAQVRVMQVVKDLPGSPAGDSNIGIQAVGVPDNIGGSPVKSQITLPDGARECIAEQRERLDPLALVLVRDRLRWEGIRHTTTEHVAHRFGIPVVALQCGA